MNRTLCRIHQTCRLLHLSGASLLLTTSLILGVIELTSVPPAQASFLNRLWNQVFRSPPPIARRGGGSRGDQFCFVTPQINPESEMMVWSDRPTLIWQSQIQRVEVGLDGEGESLWTHEVSEAERLSEAIAMTDVPTYSLTVPMSLQPGKTYEWRTYDQFGVERRVDFQVMDAEERDRITQALQQLDQELAAAGITGEAARVQRLDYFASQQLWSDYWQEILAEGTLSSELKTINSNVIADACPLLYVEESLPSGSANVSEAGYPYKDYRLDGYAGQVVEIILNSPALEGRLLLSNAENFILSETSVQADRTASLLFVLPEDEEYTIRVEANQPQAQGKYTLTAVTRFGVE